MAAGEGGERKKPTIMILYHSMWGHMECLSRAFKEGAEAAGAEVLLRRVPETLPAEVLAKMHVKSPPEDVPVADVKTFYKEADAFCFGVSTRYGCVSAQVKAFIDATGALWSAGSLQGVPMTIIYGTGTPGGGQETTALTTLIPLVHHGMIFIPLGYADPVLFSLSLRGGGPWGAGYFAGADGSRAVSEEEKGVARIHGRVFAERVAIIKAGKEALGLRAAADTK